MLCRPHAPCGALLAQRSAAFSAHQLHGQNRRLPTPTRMLATAATTTHTTDPAAAINVWAARLQARRSGDAPIVVRSVPDMRALRVAMDLHTAQALRRPARVGFVPTMGALHDGHLSLCDLARGGGGGGGHGTPPSPATDYLVSSIFVNPTQFAPHEDLSTYPRTWESDCAKLAQTGVDVVFAPLASGLYPAGAPYRTFVELSGVDSATPEGSARPGFFRGVATVVTKLLNVVGPTRAAFGQKDGIQCITVRTLVRDLNLPVEVVIGPTSREPDGLARSSRNVYLTPEQRAAAPAIYAGLQAAQREVASSPEGASALREARHARAERLAAAARAGPEGAAAVAEAAAQAAAHRHGRAAAALVDVDSVPSPGALSPFVEHLRAVVEATIRREGRGRFGEIQYITLSDGLTGAPIGSLADSSSSSGAVMLSVAARIGATRLLDNVMLVGTPADLGAP